MSAIKKYLEQANSYEWGEMTLLEQVNLRDLAAAELEAMRAVVETASEIWKTIQEIGGDGKCDNDGRGCNNESIAQDFMSSHPDFAATLAKLEVTK